MDLKNVNCFLIRGLGRELRQWGKFKNLLEKECASVHCLELPGFGSKIDEESPSKIGDYVDNLRSEFLEIQPPGEQSIICSVSLGGMITFDWLNRYPSDFDLGCVMNSSAGNLSGPLERLTLEGFTSMAGTLSLKTRREIERNVFRLVSNRYVDEKTVDDWADYSEESPPERTNFFKQLIAGMLFRAPDSIQTPLLLLASKRDRMVDVKCSEDLATHYGATIEYHLDAGHELWLDDPCWVIQRLQNFVL